MRQLLIFLKYPMPGQVKTRLAAAIGDTAASEVYRSCVEHTLTQLCLWQREAILYVDPPEAVEPTRAWVGASWRVRPQCGDGLGERLIHATTEAFREGARHVVVIGTDSPWLTAADVEEAFAALHHADLVVGPAQDGGYYLIGLAAPTPVLFKDISWSTARVHAQTIDCAQRLGLRVQTLREGYDIDRLPDLERWLADTHRRPSHA